MVQSVIARCLGLPNLWKTNTTLTEIRPYWTTVQGSLHYTDYENGYAALSLMKGYGNYGHLEIGSASRCVGCGRLHDRLQLNATAANVKSCASARRAEVWFRKTAAIF